LRTNLFEEGENDVNPARIKDPNVLPRGPITRGQAKNFKHHIGMQVQAILTKELGEHVFERRIEEASLGPKLQMVLCVNLV